MRSAKPRYRLGSEDGSRDRSHLMCTLRPSDGGCPLQMKTAQTSRVSGRTLDRRARSMWYVCTRLLCFLLSIRRSAGYGCGYTGRYTRLQVTRDRVRVWTCLTTCGLPETLLRGKVSVACVISRQVIPKRWSAMLGNLAYFDCVVGCWRMGTIVSLSSVGNAMPDGWPDVAGTRAGSLLLSLMRSERKRGVHGRTHSVGR